MNEYNITLDIQNPPAILGEVRCQFGIPKKARLRRFLGIEVPPQKSFGCIGNISRYLPRFFGGSLLYNPENRIHVSFIYLCEWVMFYGK